MKHQSIEKNTENITMVNIPTFAISALHSVLEIIVDLLCFWGALITYVHLRLKKALI